MSHDVLKVGPDDDVHSIARLLTERQVGVACVVYGDRMVGIVTEGDLIRREELGTEPRHCAVGSVDPTCLKSHGRRARDVMTPDVIVVTEDAPLSEIAQLMEGKRINYMPVVHEQRLVGIVSRARIVRALAERPDKSHHPLVCDDDIVRFKVIETLMTIPGASAWLASVSLANGVVTLSGTVEDENMREPSRRIIEELPCVKAVDDQRSILQPY
jgi:CBS domain-containing protein